MRNWNVRRAALLTERSVVPEPAQGPERRSSDGSGLSGMVGSFPVPRRPVLQYVRRSDARVSQLPRRRLRLDSDLNP